MIRVLGPVGHRIEWVDRSGASCSTPDNDPPARKVAQAVTSVTLVGTSTAVSMAVQCSAGTGDMPSVVRSAASVHTGVDVGAATAFCHSGCHTEYCTVTSGRDTAVSIVAQVPVVDPCL